MIRTILSKLRERGIDIQSTHRRDALNALTVQKRIMAGRDVRTIFDCGAHHGRIAGIYRQTFPNATIHCFEPTPDTFEILSRNHKATPNVRLVNAAVGPESGEMTFNVGSNEQSNSLSAVQGDQRGIRVKVVSLGDYCRENRIDQIDIIKIDVEGYELQALRPIDPMLRDRRVGLIHCEVRFEPLAPECTHFVELAAFMRDRGYRVYGFYDAIYAPTLRFDWGDTIFVADELLKPTR